MEEIEKKEALEFGKQLKTVFSVFSMLDDYEKEKKNKKK